MVVKAALIGMIVWVTMAVFQFGFGISELNAFEPRFTCKAAECFNLSDTAFGWITTMFTIGGAASSIACGSISKHAQISRKNWLQISAALSLVGSTLLGTTSSMLLLSTARLVQGFGAGIGVVQVPVYLQEISPPSISGEIGITNQLAVVTGIFCAQAIGTWAMAYSLPWRTVPFASCIIAISQLIVGWFWAYESPGWLDGEGARIATRSGYPSASLIRERLWGHDAYEIVDRLGTDTLPERNANADWHTDPDFRKGMRIVAMTQIAQQFSGVNAILYYSTGILSKVMPNIASYIGLLVTIVNGLLTFPPIALISESRLGRKTLMVGSATGMFVFCSILAFSLWIASPWGSALAILCVIACFSMGLGPVPFVIIPEVLPSEYVSIGSSMGLGVNWICNILVAASFPILRNVLGSYDGHTGGLVFGLFACSNLWFAAWIARNYHYVQ
ncbi:hypothetical protein MPSI1_002401 [Malassezia psittaci]|uniref:Major facilitator superfamily (MFS) profile domain-containing protein n=1 Tax=Malassezia psittaci TaxID=1821823 RepID=A0AAF0JE77_9BASI|nr:hypothetical protein MPSI1_002401 [Malassezia psittaci]